MKKVWISASLLLLVNLLFAQSLSTRLKNAMASFEKDPQLSAASVSLYVIDANTREILFDRNGHIGLAPASTQKMVTSAAALSMLGKDYRYTTRLYRSGELDGDGSLKGSLVIVGSGDPTLGSWRYEGRDSSLVMKNFANAVAASGIRKISMPMVISTPGFSKQTIPGGWVWDDIGNYYGAAPAGLNWKENQYDLVLEAAGKKQGESVAVSSPAKSYINELKAGAPGSGDNAYAYLPVAGGMSVLSGTIPAGAAHFKISASDPDPALSFTKGMILDPAWHLIYRYDSPALDSIIYWFNKKSINLYGEALIKTIALEQGKTGSTEAGVEQLKIFWEKQGIDPNELNIYDGSGLSPLNRVTTHAQVEVLRYARSQPWFDVLYNSLPIYNGMHMKSGTISKVKGFTGFQQGKDGHTYIFSFLVNNYNGSASSLVQKMYGVLDEMKK